MAADTPRSRSSSTMTALTRTQARATANSVAWSPTRVATSAFGSNVSPQRRAGLGEPGPADGGVDVLDQAALVDRLADGQARLRADDRADPSDRGEAPDVAGLVREVVPGDGQRPGVRGPSVRSGPAAGRTGRCRTGRRSPPPRPGAGSRSMSLNTQPDLVSRPSPVATSTGAGGSTGGGGPISPLPVPVVVVVVVGAASARPVLAAGRLGTPGRGSASTYGPGSESRTVGIVGRSAVIRRQRLPRAGVLRRPVHRPPDRGSPPADRPPTTPDYPRQ